MSEHEQSEARADVEAAAAPNGDAGTGLSDEEFSSLLQSINTMAPLLKGLGSLFGDGKRGEACVKREALLLALKPYLSKTRCEAVDYLVRIGRIGDVLRAMR